MKAALVSGALCLAIGLGVGSLYAGVAPSAAPVAPAVAGPERVGGMRQRHDVDALTRADLEAALRRERGAVAPAPAAAAAVAATDAPLPAALTERAARASELIETAVARGAWTDADRDGLVEHFDGLPGPIKAEIFAQLSDAVNRGEVAVQTEGLPL